MEGPSWITARVKGIRIRKKRRVEFFFMFSFVSPWMRKRSKRSILIGSMAAFCFEPKAKIPATRHKK
jgi:hypothetical protein